MRFILVLVIATSIYFQQTIRSGNPDRSDSLNKKKLLTVEDIYSNAGLYLNTLYEVKWFGDGNKISWREFDPNKGTLIIC